MPVKSTVSVMHRILDRIINSTGAVDEVFEWNGAEARLGGGYWPGFCLAVRVQGPRIRAEGLIA